MKLCPRCHREYDEQLENCLVCGSELKKYDAILSGEERAVLELDEEVTPTMLEEINPENLPEVICSVVGKEEAMRLSCLMQEHRIPCMCKENGEEEDVYDLFIPKKNFNQALEILNQDEAEMDEAEELVLEEQEPLEEGEETQQEEAPSLKKRFWQWLTK